MQRVRFAKCCDKRNEGEQNYDDFNFCQLKSTVEEMVDYFDHTLIIEQGTLKEKTMDALKEEGFCIREVVFRPTAECFSAYFYQILRSKNYEVANVNVYETPNNCASYSE